MPERRKIDSPISVRFVEAFEEMTSAFGGFDQSSLALHNATLEVNADGRKLAELRQRRNGIIDKARLWPLMSRLRGALCNICMSRAGSPLLEAFSNTARATAGKDGEQPSYVFGCRPGEEEITNAVLDKYGETYEDFARDAVDVESTGEGVKKDDSEQEIIPDHVKGIIDERIADAFARYVEERHDYNFIKLRAVRRGDSARLMEDGKTFSEYVARKIAEMFSAAVQSGTIKTPSVRERITIELSNQTKSSKAKANCVGFYITIPFGEDNNLDPQNFGTHWGYDPSERKSA